MLIKKANFLINCALNYRFITKLTKSQQKKLTGQLENPALWWSGKFEIIIQKRITTEHLIDFPSIKCFNVIFSDSCQFIILQNKMWTVKSP